MYEERAVTEDLVRSNEVLGVDVKNPEMESLGEIEEIVLDKYNGTVRYVVLDFGGFLGIGSKLFALPWKAIHYNKEEECFILNVDKEKLKNAPGFDKDNWPNMADRTWARGIHEFYGVDQTF